MSYAMQKALEAALTKKGAVSARPLPKRHMFTLPGEQHRRDLPSAVLAVIKRGQAE